MKEITYRQHIDGRLWKIRIIDTGKTAPFTEGDCPDTPSIIWDIAVIVDEQVIHTAPWYAEAGTIPTPMNVLPRLISHVIDAALTFVQNSPAPELDPANHALRPTEIGPDGKYGRFTS